MTISLDVFPKLMPMILLRSRKTAGQDKPSSNQPLHVPTNIVSIGLERLGVGLAGRRKGSTRDCAARTIFINHASGQQRGPALLVVPIKARRNTPREYPATSAQPSPFTSWCSCQCAPPRSEAPQCCVSCEARNIEPSVPPNEVRLKRNSGIGSLVGRRDMRLTIPAIAALP